MRTIRSKDDLSLAARMLALEILDRAGNGKGTCTASTKTLAKGAGINERHVVRMLGELEAAGWIVVHRSGESKNSPRRKITMGPAFSVQLHAPDPEPTPTPEQSYSDTESELLRHQSGQTSSLTGSGTEGTFAFGDEEGEFPKALLKYSRVRPMAASEATNRAAVEAWVAEAFNGIAGGTDYEDTFSLIHLAAGKDSARLGLSQDDIDRRTWWIDCATRAYRMPESLVDLCEGVGSL